MMQYQVFPVTKRVFDSVKIRGYFQGGICVEGTLDDTDETKPVYLLVIKYFDQDYLVEQNQPPLDEGEDANG